MQKKERESVRAQNHSTRDVSHWMRRVSRPCKALEFASSLVELHPLTCAGVLDCPKVIYSHELNTFFSACEGKQIPINDLIRL